MQRQMYNFCAGPAGLPESVTAQLLDAINDFQGTGVSVLSISHRDERFLEMAEKTKQALRQLLNIPKAYHILFLQGGATNQFSMIARNLLNHNKALYLDCGYWSKLAISEASKIIQTQVIQKPYDELFLNQSYQIDGDYDYFHFIDNETIDGREFQYVPKTKNVPLVCDMSSNLLSRWFDIERFGLIYAGAQKNLGIPGVTVVIVHNDLVKPLMDAPSMYSYYDAVKQNSLVNTPVVCAWYTMHLMFNWLLSEGGVKKVELENKLKAKCLYDYLDQSKLFTPLVSPAIRSRMNIVFKRVDNDLDKTSDLIKQAETDGFYGINGHRSIGGFRVSLYNAMSVSKVERLVEYLQDYEKHIG